MILQDFYFCQNQIIERLYASEEYPLPIEDKDTKYLYSVLTLEIWPVCVGVIKALNPEEYELVDVLVISSCRRNKLGTYVIKFLETRVKAMGGRKVYVDAPVNLIEFFSKIGYTKTSDKYFKKNKKNYVRMSKTIAKPRYPHKY